MTEPTITPIQTKYDGRFFRSRTEARWAVFFKALGLQYEHEKEGFDLNGRWYLPDFWLSELACWLEVKGTTPTTAEIDLCRELAVRSGKPAFIVEGQPQAGAKQWWHFKPDGYFLGHMMFLADRRNDGEYWVADIRDGMLYSGESIGPLRGQPHDREPVINDRLTAAYETALSERFAAA